MNKAERIAKFLREYIELCHKYDAKLTSYENILAVLLEDEDNKETFDPRDVFVENLHGTVVETKDFYKFKNEPEVCAVLNEIQLAIEAEAVKDKHGEYREVAGTPYFSWIYRVARKEPNS